MRLGITRAPVSWQVKWHDNCFVHHIGRGLIKEGNFVDEANSMTSCSKRRIKFYSISLNRKRSKLRMASSVKFYVMGLQRSCARVDERCYGLREERHVAQGVGQVARRLASFQLILRSLATSSANARAVTLTVLVPANGAIESALESASQSESGETSLLNHFIPLTW